MIISRGRCVQLDNISVSNKTTITRSVDPYGINYLAYTGSQLHVLCKGGSRHDGASKVEKAVSRIILLDKDGTGVAACGAKISLFTNKKHLFISATTNN